MKDFRSQQIWNKAHQLTLRFYKVTREFPTDERYGLTSQLRRAASSIPANLAEGCGRGSDADFGRCVQIAMGSASELEYHLLLSSDLEYLSKATHDSLDENIIEIKRMLASLIRKLKADR